MDIQYLHDILEYIRDATKEGYWSDLKKVHIYGRYGYRIKDSDVRKVLEALRKRDISSFSLDQILDRVKYAIRNGFRRVRFMKHHWEFIY